MINGQVLSHLINGHQQQYLCVNFFFFFRCWFYFNSVFVPWNEKNSNAMTHSQTVNNLFPCYNERRRVKNRFWMFETTIEFLILYERNHHRIFQHVSHDKINKNFNKYLYGLNIWTFCFFFAAFTIGRLYAEKPIFAGIHKINIPTSGVWQFVIYLTTRLKNG